MKSEFEVPSRLPPIEIWDLVKKKPAGTDVAIDGDLYTKAAPGYGDWLAVDHRRVSFGNMVRAVGGQPVVFLEPEIERPDCPYCGGMGFFNSRSSCSECGGTGYAS